MALIVVFVTPKWPWRLLIGDALLMYSRPPDQPRFDVWSYITHLAFSACRSIHRRQTIEPTIISSHLESCRPPRRCRRHRFRHHLLRRRSAHRRCSCCHRGSQTAVRTLPRHPISTPRHGSAAASPPAWCREREAIPWPCINAVAVGIDPCQPPGRRHWPRSRVHKMVIGGAVGALPSATAPDTIVGMWSSPRIQNTY